MVILLMDRISTRINSFTQCSKIVFRKSFFQFVVSGFIFIILSQEINAGEIEFTPSLEVKQSYTDNLYLSTPGNEQGEFVTEVSPAFLLRMSGARFNAVVDLTMQNLFYNKFRESNTTFYQLNATSTSEMVKDYFYFDANANHGQRIIDTNSPIGSNNIAITNNVANATSFVVSPYFRHSYRNLFDALARYSYSEVNYRRGESDNSRQSVYDVRLNTPVQKMGYTWSANVLNQKTDYETSSDSLLKKRSLQLGYRYPQRTHIYASGGRDENTYDNSSTPDISESFWIVGADLQFGGRDFVSFGYGERFFGPTGNFRWEHRARRLNFNMSYREEFSNSALIFLGSNQSAASSSLNTNSTLQNQANNSITTETFLQKVGTLGLTYNFSKTSISVGYSDDQRNFQVSGSTTRTKRASLSINLRSTNRLTYVLNTIWNRRNDSTTNLNNFDTLVRLSAIRRLSPSLDLEFLLSHNIRRGQDSTIDYNENIASVSLTKVFN